MFSSACLEQCAPKLVGEGVAQLTIRNSGAILELINADTQCGFESPEVKSAVWIDGEAGKLGTATWTVTECEIDLRETPQVTTDCNGNETTVGGLLRVSATRTIGGTLTGDPEQPVVPAGPEAVTIKVDSAELRNFYVDSTEDENVLKIRSGKLSFVAQPKLAVSVSNGVCMIPTPNIRISDIKYERGRLNVRTSSRNFEVPVKTSDLYAVNGLFGAAENVLSGRITVWGRDVEIAPKSGLNPEYDPQSFSDSFACTDDLRTPVTFECQGLEPILAQGAARLTMQSFGSIVSALDKDTRCGFSSPQAQAGLTLSGPTGSLGSAEVSVTDCTLEFATETKSRTDCNGQATTVSGKITVSGRRVLEGRLTGDPNEPVVPMKDGPGFIEITRATFDNFKVASGGNALTQVNGGISGVLYPRVAKDSVRGACSIETGIARFDRIQYTPATDLIISSAGLGTFRTTVEGSNLTAVNGSWQGDTNVLRGQISIGKETFDLPTNPDDDGLNPEFDQAKFDASWQCNDAKLPADFDCHFVEPLAQGASQLSVMAMGAVARVLENDETCGFKSPGVLASVAYSGALGEQGTATLELLYPCEMTFATPTEVDSDCNGDKTFVQGTVRATGSRTIRGYMTGHPQDVAVPTGRDAVQVDLDATFTNFRIWRSSGDNAITIKQGGLSGTVKPRMAIDTERGACAIPTPVAQFENVQYTDADLRIESEGKAFDVRADTAMLNAQNGAGDVNTNYLAGVISIDGTLVPIPTDGQPILDPEYDPVAFANSYACTANMRIPASSDECLTTVRKTIGEGAARLLIQNLGVVTKLVNNDGDCGFDSNLTSPDRVTGRPGEIGEMEWSISQCQMSRELDKITEPVDEDCDDVGTFYEGQIEVSGRRVVRGVREDINIFFLRFHSISPNTRESVDVFLDYIDFDEFKAYTQSPSETTPRRALTIHDGVMSAFAQPVLGENSRNSGTYDIATPIARFTNIEIRNAPITLVNEGMTFKVNVDSAELSAFNGSFRRERNTISGDITVDGMSINMPAQDLDPEYDQGAFDRSYSCTRNLRAVVPPL